MTLASTYPDLSGLYERLAPNYDKLHRRWLRHAGGEAQAALEAAVRALVFPGARLLDAGSGTGVFVRRLLEEGVIAKENATLVDPSDAMLRHSSDLACQTSRGRLEDLPFEDGSFDIVTCAWALETATDPIAAIAEMRRVLRPAGVICLVFCADEPARGALQWLIRRSLSLRGTGRFLASGAVCEAISATGGLHVISVPVTGPAAMIVAKCAPQKCAR